MWRAVQRSFPRAARQLPCQQRHAAARGCQGQRLALASFSTLGSARRPAGKGGSAGVTYGMVAFGTFGIGAVLYASSDTCHNAVNRALDRLNESFEDFNDASRDVFEWIGEMIVPLKKGPWLLELAEMKYPDHIPTLVMDLDKVLLFLEHDSKAGWRVVKRPFADQFIKELSHYYELVIYSDDVYPVALDIVVKWNLPVNGVLHRDFCKKKRNHFIKDISQLGRRLDRVLIVDHDEVSMEKHPENGVHIRPFEGDPDDRELVDMLEFLKAAAACNTDIRTFVRKYKESEDHVADADIGRRYLLEQQKKAKTVANRRVIGQAFQKQQGQRQPGGQPGFGRP